MLGQHISGALDFTVHGDGRGGNVICFKAHEIFLLITSCTQINLSSDVIW